MKIRLKGRQEKDIIFSFICDFGSEEFYTHLSDLYLNLKEEIIDKITIEAGSA